MKARTAVIVLAVAAVLIAIVVTASGGGGGKSTGSGGGGSATKPASDAVRVSFVDRNLGLREQDVARDVGDFIAASICDTTRGPGRLH